MQLHDVHEGIQKHRRRKRIGRGPGSGHGKTSGRGHKGAGSRAGNSRRMSFEGGQMPLARRVAKRGFSNAYHAPVVAIINVSTLESSFEAGAEVSLEALSAKRLLPSKFDVLKVLGNGDLSKSLTVTAHQFSRSAEEKITAAGGTVTRIG